MQPKRLLRLIILSLCLHSLPVWAGDDIDVLKMRENIGENAFKAKISDMKSRLYKDIDHALLARMIVAEMTKDKQEYQATWTAVQKAAAKGRAEIAKVEQGQYQDAWRENRWLKAAFAAKSPDARTLFERTFLDQFYPGFDLPRPQAYAATVLIIPTKTEITRHNVIWLKGVLKRIQWFDISKYGEDASMAAWLLVQHADFAPAWQAEVLHTLKAKLASHDFQPRYYAYLADRVAVGRHDAQTYGTQGRCIGKSWEPFTLKDAAKVDTWRADVGLQSLAKYKARFHCR